MEPAIQTALNAIESREGVRILYACESGSRAWGFASPDSDFDVRFLYVHPRDWYLSIENKREVIEEMLPNDLDLAGWDLRKTLGLLRKSNPALIEWLRSPIVYRQDDGFMAEMRALATEYASPQRCFRHYLHMAEGNWNTYLQSASVRHKKYFYVLRPVLAARWIERRMEMAPMGFGSLMEVLDEADVRAAVSGLLAVKAVSSEMDSAAPIPELNAFLGSELARLKEVPWPKESPIPVDPLNAFFRRWVRG